MNTVEIALVDFARTGEDALGFALGLPLKANARADGDRPVTSCRITRDSKRKPLMCYSRSCGPRSSRCYYPQLDAMPCHACLSECEERKDATAGP